MVHNCDYKVHSCDYEVQNCDYNLQNCDHKVHSCDFKVHNFDYKVQTCDYKEPTKLCFQGVYLRTKYKPSHYKVPTITNCVYKVSKSSVQTNSVG